LRKEPNHNARNRFQSPSTITEVLREIWILTLITFINRAGTMVLPFLSKYLKEDLNLSYAEVGWIMVAFGMGSMLGSLAGR
jgi:predicted MFS family arabinose efflux permease